MSEEADAQSRQASRGRKSSVAGGSRGGSNSNNRRNTKLKVGPGKKDYEEDETNGDENKSASKSPSKLTGPKTLGS